jgi:hypothetical protein
MGRDNVGNRGVDGSIILKSILDEKYMTIRIGFIWLRMWTGGGLVINLLVP